MQGDGWRVGLLAREALLNVFGPASRMFALVMLAVLAGAGSSAYGAFEAHAMRQEISELAGEGRNVVVFSALNNDAPASIERSSCEALTKQPGTLRAGLLIEDGQLDVMPIGVRVPVQRASTTLLPELGTADLLVGRALLERDSQPFVVRAGGSFLNAVRARASPEDLGVGSSGVSRK